MTEHSDAGDGVGDELARARAALGFSITDVAQQLKFAPRQIEALEQGRFEHLAAGTYARGMVRAYARLLKLDAEPLVERIAGRLTAPDKPAAVASVRRPIPMPGTDRARRSNLIYASLSLAILGLIAAVVFEWQRERADAARLSFVAAAQAQLQPAAAPQRVASAGVMPPNTVALTDAGALPATAPALAVATEGMRRIVLKFERTSWVEIRGHDGKALISQLNPAGSERLVEGKPPFAVVIGNAQHVRLSYDERPVDLAPHVKVEVARFTLE